MKSTVGWKLAAAATIAACLFAFAGCASKTSGSTVVYGKVTAVSGNKITLALGTMADMGGPGGQAGDGASRGQPPADGQGGGTPPQGDTDNMGAASRPTMNENGGQGGMGPGGSLTLTGKNKTITIIDTSVLQKMSFGGAGNDANGAQTNGNTITTAAGTGVTVTQADNEATASATQQDGGQPQRGDMDEGATSSASLSDISVGSILKITYGSDGKTITSIVIFGSGSQDTN